MYINPHPHPLCVFPPYCSIHLKSLAPWTLASVGDVLAWFSFFLAFSALSASFLYRVGSCAKHKQEREQIGEPDVG